MISLFLDDGISLSGGNTLLYFVHFYSKILKNSYVIQGSDIEISLNGINSLKKIAIVKDSLTITIFSYSTPL